MRRQDELKYLLQDKKIPILVLDQKWHRLFDMDKKPHRVVVLEKQLNKLLMHRGQLHTDINDLKQLKTTLMNSIVVNMDGTEEKANPLSERKLKENRRLITDINHRLEGMENELLELPLEIEELNRSLLEETISFCYDILHTNSEEIIKISGWISQMRIDLKKNIIKRQECELKSREIYSYMHDIFGVQVIDMFDLKSDNISLGASENDILEETKLFKDIEE